jgi:hypothetical protein
MIVLAERLYELDIPQIQDAMRDQLLTLQEKYLHQFKLKSTAYEHLSTKYALHP